MKPNEIDQVRNDIKSYEHHKKVKHLSTLGVLGGIGAAGVGGYKKHMPTAILGGGAALASGFAKGHAKRKEQAALNRIKNFYDLRKLKHEIEHEKVAVIGGLAELASAGIGALGHLAHIPFMEHFHSLSSAASEYAPVLGPALVSATDIATIPAIARWQGAKTLEHAQVAAKNAVYGSSSLSPKELSTLSKSISARAGQLKTEAMKPGLMKSIREYFSPLSGPKGTGGHYGEILGKGLKQVNEYSPRYARMGVEAIGGGVGLKNLEQAAMKDIGTFKQVGSILDSVQDEIPFMRRAMNATGTNLSGTAKKILHDPNEAVHMAQGLKDTVIKSVRGGKYMLGAAALAGIGAGIGKYRKRHALATDSLPKKIIGYGEGEDNVLPFRNY